MNPYARLLLFGAVSVVLLLAAAAAGRAWLERETRTLQRTWRAEAETHLDAALALSGGKGRPTPADLQALSALFGGTARLETAAPEGTAVLVRRIGTPEAPLFLVIDAAPPPYVSVAARTFRLWIGLGLGLLVLIALALLVAALPSRRMAPPVREAGPSEGFQSLSQLARSHAEAEARYTVEKEQRRRAEEDLQVQQVLVTRALEEKVRLGRDLHDGVIQTLYSAGLQVETAARRVRDGRPAEAGEVLGRVTETLNQTIREIRTFILGISPDTLRRRRFADSVAALSSLLGAGREVAFDVRIDDATADALDEARLAEVLQIVREGVSNALRHGQATRVEIRLAGDGEQVALALHDNGRGFDTAAPRKGLGLGNTLARVKSLGGTLDLTSAPGSGTRVRVLFPLSPP